MHSHAALTHKGLSLFCMLVRDFVTHVMHCRGGKPLADECDCTCVCVCACVRVCVCIKRKITCSVWWLIHRLVCQGAAGWLEAVRQETHQLCTAELKTPLRFMQDSLTFLLNWCLICSWPQNSRLNMLHAVLLWEPPHTLQSVTLTASFTPH